MARDRGTLVRRVGSRIRELREARNLTQEELGVRAGYTAKYVSEIERGLRDPPLSTLDRLASNGLACQVQDLLGPGVRANPARARPPVAWPRAVRKIADELAALPPSTRTRVVAVIRAVMALARGM
ncbi:MAG: helix-turn-helix domain-containing protein [Myxococcales bacterium]|nr:helix-turn-helix domain-containing protein [Myxococcales bacterium]MCB9576648.1 helix-turn-helix domain-containing protein [Polyangiaceae bacterium]